MHVIVDSHDQTASTSRSNVVASDQTKEIEGLKRDLGKPLYFTIDHISLVSMRFQRP